MEYLMISVALIGCIGVAAQWLAWRMNIPAIVLMSLAGLFIGPITGLIRPEEAFGDFYRPAISLAVAIILFEGGMTLNFSEIRGLRDSDSIVKAVRRLVVPGVFIAWILGAFAAHHIAGLSWPVAALFAGIMVVTGPTVIMPLLRQAKLTQRPRAFLKWEGIVNDPIGALFAVFAFEYIIISQGHTHGSDHGEWSFQAIMMSLIVGTILTAILGYVLARGIVHIFRRGMVPEYLKSPILLVTVLFGFALANLLQEEAGLITVTVMGVVIANAKLPSINQLRLFKEHLTTLFVSGVFVMLTASLTFSQMSGVTWPMIAFVLVMIFVVRPVTIFVSTIGAGMTMEERLMLMWIAPRGIVAVAVSGFFAGVLVDRGFEDAAQLIPLAFLMVFATVVMHGFTMAPLGRMLGLTSTSKPGFLLVGASPWAIEFGAKLKEMGQNVTIADDDYYALKPARAAGLDVYYGEILSEVTEHHINLSAYQYLVALSGNEAYSALVCHDLAPEMNRAATYQLSTQGTDEHDPKALSYSVQGQSFLQNRLGIQELIRRHFQGWGFQATKLTDIYTPDQYKDDLPESAEIILVIREEQYILASAQQPIELQIGDEVLAYTKKADETA